MKTYDLVNSSWCRLHLKIVNAPRSTLHSKTRAIADVTLTRPSLFKKCGLPRTGVYQPGNKVTIK